MNKHLNTSLNSFSQDKDNHFIAEKIQFYDYLQQHTATASMVSDATGIPQKNICRYKREYEKAGLIWEIEKKVCKKTGFKAWYLSTNIDEAIKHNLVENKPIKTIGATIKTLLSMKGGASE